MAKYIILGKYTTQGISRIKDGPGRTAAARKAFDAAGCKMTEFSLTLGHYDFVTQVEAPDDETFARALLAIASSGNITTETLRAFTEEEYTRITASLP
ncbi:MAG TPA: GYD domain-containing protein [Dehalococcoidia bacterium]|nr:GYD domain-containing protein [Dehalococcoidia bacterium]